MVDGERISSAECGKSGLPSMYHSASGLSLTEQAQRDGVIVAPENFYKSKLGAGRIVLQKEEHICNVLNFGLVYASLLFYEIIHLSE